MKIALGGAQFGLPYGVSNKSGQISRQAAGEIVDLARLVGVDTIDTAIAYGDSEASLGEVGINDFKVVTKLPPTPDGIADVTNWVRAQIESSLERLGLRQVHALLLHRADDLLGNHGQSLVKALERARKDGMVAKVGVSVYDPEQLAAIVPVYPVDIVQAPLNLLDRRLETSGWLNRLHELGVEIHTRSTFLQGLLLMDRAAIPMRFERWSHLWDTWQTWLSEQVLSPTRACLQYPLSLPQVDRVVVGVSTKAEFKMLLDDAIVGITTTELPDIGCVDADLINPSNWNSY